MERKEPLRIVRFALTIAFFALASAAAAQYTFTTYAGSSPGSEDGLGAAARFRAPGGIAADASGNVYVISDYNTVRKISSSGDVTTLAGFAGTCGGNDGVGAAARLCSAHGLALDSSGNVYVSDWGTLRKITQSRVVTTLAGTFTNSGSVDATGPAASFSYPYGVAVDSSNNVFMADFGNHTIRKITPAGVVTTFAGSTGNPGSTDATGTNASFNRPLGLAIDASNNLYVADQGNSTIRKITPGAVVTTLAGLAGQAGNVDDVGSAARFNYPEGVAVDSSGNVYVADTSNHTIRKITPARVVSTYAGSYRGYGDGTGSNAQFDLPLNVAVSGTDVFVADYNNHVIRKIAAGGVVTTLAGKEARFWFNDGTRQTARFTMPCGIATDQNNNSYVTDFDANEIRKIASDGTVTTFAGCPFCTGSSNGNGQNATFSQPCGITIDSSNNLYVADTGNHVIRKITPSADVTTLAGSAGLTGTANGLGSIARFNRPMGIDTDGTYLYVADLENHTIRKITMAGDVSTLAGSGGVPGNVDDTGSAARFYYPTGVTADTSGNLFVSDFYNHSVRKIVISTAAVTTFAGGPYGTDDGTGLLAQFTYPADITADGAGNLFVTDGSRVRKITPGAVVSTIGGSGINGSNDGTGSSAEFNFNNSFHSYGVSTDSLGNVYVADGGNQVIRRGSVGLTDAATIDSNAGPIGTMRQLGTTTQTATSWQWSLIRRPANSTAQLTATNVRTPQFTPDVADTYIFRLVASNATQSSITTVRLDVNTQPGITAAAPIAATAGSAASLVTLATVSDAEDPASLLSVSATNVPSGITLTSLTNNNGTVQATVGASCSAAPGANIVTLRVQDSFGGSATATLTVNVTANPAPTLGTYNNATVLEGQPLTVSPSFGPADNGSATASGFISSGYHGGFSVDSVTGNVTLTSPNAGTYTVSLYATDNCGTLSSGSGFIVTVNAAPDSNRIFNGGFEINGGVNSTSLTGWSTYTPTATGSWYAQSGTASPTPGSGATVVAPPQGSFAAMAAQSSPGTFILYQDVVLPRLNTAAVVSFRVYLYNTASAWYSPATLDSSTGQNQQFRADILTPGDPIDSVFPLIALYATQPGDPLSANAYKLVSATIPANLTGQTLRLRFAVAANQGFLNAGVDDVRVVTGTSSLTTSRSLHGATLLTTGDVLITGGYNATGGLNTAELYDTASGHTAAISNLTSGRVGHTATPLRNGKVVLIGGDNGFGDTIATAESYDPVSHAFSATAGNLSVARTEHTATLLPNGNVLLVGGYTYTGGGLPTFLNSAELFNPQTGTFTTTGSLVTGVRASHTATLLPNGKVLIAGGQDTLSHRLNTAEIYDPGTGTFTQTTGNMTVARGRATATLLPNGKVLLAGGFSTTTLSSAELFDYTTGTFAATAGPLATTRQMHGAALLPSGKVLIIGGGTGGCTVRSTVELYDPTASTFSTIGTIVVSRSNPKVVLLQNGRVLVAGGDVCNTTDATIETFDPAAAGFTSTGNLNTARFSHTATLLASGNVLIAGGGDVISNTFTRFASAETYDPATGLFTTTAGGMNAARSAATATLLLNGKVLIAGGDGSAGSPLQTAELYDPVTRTFTTTGSLNTPRDSHTATLLPDGRVLITGGNITLSQTRTVSTEIYDPATGIFSTSGDLHTARAYHTAMLLANGKVLVASGLANVSFAAKGEIYDPSTGQFTETGKMLESRESSYSALLTDGRVIVFGGYSSGPLASAEIYDPASGTFSTTGSMLTLRYNGGSGTACVLPNGRVMINGGRDTTATRVTSAEVYDPVSGFFTSSGQLAVGRSSQTTTLMLNGKVLIAGGYTGTAALSGAEIYDPGLGYAAARQPVASTMTSPIVQPAAIAIAGSGFTGDSEGTSEGSNSSANNTPLFHLQRVDNEQIFIVRADSATSWTSTSFSTTGLASMPLGYYRATLYVNGVPSQTRSVAFDHAPQIAGGSAVNRTAGAGASIATIATISDADEPASGLTVTATVLPTGMAVDSLNKSGGTVTANITAGCGAATGENKITFQVQDSAGATATTTLTVNVSPNPAPTLGTYSNLSMTAYDTQTVYALGHPADNGSVTVAVSGPSAAGTLTVNQSTGNVQIAAPSPGTYTITVTATDNCGATAVRSFTVTAVPVFGTPTGFKATSATASGVTLTWNSVGGTSPQYEIWRTTNVITVPFTHYASASSTSFTDTGVTSNTTYVYKIKAVDGQKESGFTPLWAATTITFTDDPIPTHGAMKVVHITQLRTAVNAMRAAGNLTATTFTDPSPTTSTKIKAAHVTELRTALNQARSAIGVTALTYTDPTINAASTKIKAVHIDELRKGVK